MKKSFVALLLLPASFVMTAKSYAPLPCEYDGTMMPYDFSVAESRQIPDSLAPFHLEYLARHGARFLSSERSKVEYLLQALEKADKKDLLTHKGKEFMQFVMAVDKASQGEWGMLSSVGRREEVRLAHIMLEEFPALLSEGSVVALSTYVPRVVNSMYTFTSVLNLLNPKLKIYTSEGEQNSRLLRFFNTDSICYQWLHPDSGSLMSDEKTGGNAVISNLASWEKPLKRFEETHLPVAPAARLFKNALDKTELQKLSKKMYGILQSLRATAMGAATTRWMTEEEYYACWECANADHYLKHSLSKLSSIPVEAAMSTLIDIVESADHSITDHEIKARLLFGHAETLMPIAALMNLPGARELPPNLDSLASVWRDYDITPLAANILLTLAYAPSGAVYAQVSLNGADADWLLWSDLKSQWLNQSFSQSLSPQSR